MQTVALVAEVLGKMSSSTATAAGLGNTVTTPFALGAYLGYPTLTPAGEATFEASYDSFVSTMGTAPSFIDVGFNVATPVSTWATSAIGAAQTFAALADTKSATPVISLPMASTASGSLSADAQYKLFASGQYDTVLQGIVKAWANSGIQNLVFRPGWEMNLIGGPTYAGSDAQSQADWVSAFQHIYTVLHQAAAADGVSVQVVWNPSASNYGGTSTLTNLYPGNNYVDVIGADFYADAFPYSDYSTTSYHDWATGAEDTTLAQFIANPINQEHYWSDPAANQWVSDASSSGALSLTTLMAFAQAQGKPFAIPETGSGNSTAGHDVTDDAAFPAWLSQQLLAAQASGLTVSFVNLWDTNGVGSYEFSQASDGKPLEAAAWAKYFGATPVIALATAPTATNSQTTILGATAPGFGSDALSVTLTSDANFATGSSVTLANGELVYTPGTITVAKAGSDTLGYTVTDTTTGATTLETQMVTLVADAAPTVTLAAATPTATNVQTATLGTVEASSTAPATDLIAVNLTSDADFDTGSAIVLTNGSLVYTPGLVTLAQAGADLIKYTVTDTTTGVTVNETQTVTLSNGPAPVVTLAIAPTANNTQTTTLGMAIAGFGSDALSVALTGDSTFGVSANGGGNLALVDGKIVYTPGTVTNAEVGTDVLNYTVTDTVTGAVTTETQPVALAVAPAVASITGSPDGFAYLVQTPGVTTITAFNDGNVIYAVAGNVTITAGAGRDAVVGGDNSLTVRLNGNFDAVSAGNGNDTISGSQGSVYVGLGSGNDHISLGGLANTVTAGDGADTITGGQGSDAVTLGDGQDTVIENGLGNVITVGSGSDTIVAGAGSDLVTTGGGNDTITLTGNGNKVSASGGDNTILASATLGGSNLSLGNGNNTVTLGGSYNALILGNGTNAVSSSGSGDVIQLSGGKANLTFSGSNDIAFLGGSSATITDTSNYLTLNVAPGGSDIIQGLGATRGGIIDLLGGNGGFTSAAAVIQALVSDGSGGTLLPLGTSSSIDFVRLTPQALTASNFHIG